MRYFVAMIFAIVATALTAIYLSSPIASWAVAQMSFDSPDQVGELHSALFITCNLVGMLVGWTIGWAIAGPLKTGPRPE